MTGIESQKIEINGQVIDLRNRNLAAFLAWLWPGAGHLYQGRRFKGWLLMACILTTFIMGFILGSGRVVYASAARGDFRWQFGFQAAIGIPTMPAMIQGMRMRQNTDKTGATRPSYEPLWGGFMAPPRRPILDMDPDDLARWHAEAGAGFELGSWYTVIAGILNILAIFDAYGGPLDIAISGRRPKSSPQEEKGGQQT